MNSPLPTQYAPAQRARSEEVQRQAQYFSSAPPLLRQLLEAMPDILTVLNRERQIVYANQQLLNLLGVGLDSVIGLRPGEAINCVHAFESDSGCGTTEFCSTCGAVRAILAAQRGTTNVQECLIAQRPEGEALDLRVWATPLEVEGEPFTIFTIVDISHEKRRRALEHIFFHDVMNVATVLQGASGLLQEELRDQAGVLTRLIYTHTQKLVEEIEAQRQLMEAENNELSIQPVGIHVASLLQEVADSYRVHEVGQDRQIHLDEKANGLIFRSDLVLLRRVIGNMVKNALEASQPGQTVTLGGEQHADQIELWVHNPNPMPRAVQLQIFQRSFSTKGAGRGLGTYSMKLLGERYLKGRVTFTTSATGTMFKICCPLDLEAGNPTA